MQENVHHLRSHPSKAPKAKGRPKAYAAAEETAAFPENNPRELNVCLPKLGFLRRRSINAKAAIVHQQRSNQYRNWRRRRKLWFLDGSDQYIWENNNWKAKQVYKNRVQLPNLIYLLLFPNLIHLFYRSEPKRQYFAFSFLCFFRNWIF